MKRSIATVLASLLATTALAAGSSEHGDHGQMETMMSGMPGMLEDVDRTIDVTMRETDDGAMIFEPSEFEIEQGETIRFTITNQGELEHEFVLDSMEGNANHKAMMAEREMEHDMPNSVTLDAGESGEVIWKFTSTGAFEVACLIPGHYEAGMHSAINVAQGKMAQADVSQIYTKGVVKKIKADKGKVTIIHEELVELNMPAMTMVFQADDEIIAQLSEGQQIEFAVERVKGKLTVTGLK